MLEIENAKGKPSKAKLGNFEPVKKLSKKLVRQLSPDNNRTKIQDKTMFSPIVTTETRAGFFTSLIEKKALKSKGVSAWAKIEKENKPTAAAVSFAASIVKRPPPSKILIARSLKTKSKTLPAREIQKICQKLEKKLWEKFS